MSIQSSVGFVLIAFRIDTLRPLERSQGAVLDNVSCKLTWRCAIQGSKRARDRHSCSPGTLVIGRASLRDVCVFQMGNELPSALLRAIQDLLLAQLLFHLHEHLCITSQRAFACNATVLAAEQALLHKLSSLGCGQCARSAFFPCTLMGGGLRRGNNGCCRFLPVIS